MNIIGIIIVKTDTNAYIKNNRETSYKLSHKDHFHHQQLIMHIHLIKWLEFDKL